MGNLVCQIKIEDENEEQVTYVPEKRFTIMMLGSSGVGKTSLIDQTVNNRFCLSVPPTIGHESQFIMVTLQNRKRIHVNIIDTPGYQTFLDCLPPSLILRADAIVYVYQDQDEQSKRYLQRCHRKVVLSLKESGTSKQPLLYSMRNKIDLVYQNNQTIVQDDNGPKFIKSENQFQTSALFHFNITRLFAQITNDIHDVKGHTENYETTSYRYLNKCYPPQRSVRNSLSSTQ